MLDEQLIGIDSSEVSLQSLALYVNNQFATQLALPAAAQGEPKKPKQIKLKLVGAAPWCC